MSSTEATQALLPVTPEDREAAIAFGDWSGRTRADLNGPAIRAGEWDHTEDVQAFARHRQSHSLPGDVGMREVCIDVVAHLAAAISLLEAGGKAAKKAAPSDKMFDQMLRDYKRSLNKARAALTPSALSGDAGEGERLEHARTALQRIRERFTNIGNSSPLWCDMAEDMDAYAAEGLDRSKARG